KNGYGAHTELECAPLDGWPELVAQVQAELDDSAATPSHDLSGVGNRSSVVAGVGDGSRRLTEIEVVEGIEKVCAELQLHPFRNGEGLHSAHVPVPHSRAKEHIASGRSPLPGLRRSEGIDVVPLHTIDDVVRARLPSFIERCARHLVGTAWPPTG